MNPTELRRLAIEVVGERGWQTRLAERLEVDPSTVRRWISGAVPIPSVVGVALRCLAEKAIRASGEKDVGGGHARSMK